MTVHDSGSIAPVPAIRHEAAPPGMLVVADLSGIFFRACLGGLLASLAAGALVLALAS